MKLFVVEKGITGDVLVVKQNGETVKIVNDYVTTERRTFCDHEIVDYVRVMNDVANQRKTHIPGVTEGPAVDFLTDCLVEEMKNGKFAAAVIKNDLVYFFITHNRNVKVMV